MGVERIRTANTLLERKLKRVKVVLLFCMLMHAMFVLHMHMCVYPRPTCKQTSAVLETCWSVESGLGRHTGVLMDSGAHHA